MNPVIYTVAFKIAVKPFSKFNPQERFQGLAIPNAFSLMLTDCMTAILCGNLSMAVNPPVASGPLPSGYLGSASVLDVGNGLRTIQSLIDRYGLAGDCEIAWRGISRQWHHFSGPNLGDFEQHFQELLKWKSALESMNQAPL
jgi:hypothetical protein